MCIYNCSVLVQRYSENMGYLFQFSVIGMSKIWPPDCSADLYNMNGYTVVKIIEKSEFLNNLDFAKKHYSLQQFAMTFPQITILMIQLRYTKMCFIITAILQLE